MSRKRILVADDEIGVRESINLVLGDDHDLTYTEDGIKTLEKLRNETFDVCLLDMKMPKMDGFDILKTLKAEGIETPIVVLTAYQSMELAQEAVKMGARDYLPKPFERQHIIKAINDV